MTGDESLRARHAAEFEALLPEHLARLRWSTEALRAERGRGLRALVSAAKAGSAWDRKRLAAADADRLTAEDLASIPPMTKGALMRIFGGIVTDRRLSRSTVEGQLDGGDSAAYLFDRYRVVASGGSSGTRGVFIYDWNGWLHLLLTFSRWRVDVQRRDPRLCRR